jgi:hypothetical protein
MEPREDISRREVLRFMGVSLVVPAVKLFAKSESLQTSEHKTGVELIGGVPTFVCDGKALLTPAFKTYVPTQYYFGQFAEAGTNIFGFSTNAAACDYGHSKTTWVEADTWDYSQFEERAAAVLSVKPDALLLPRVNLGTPRWWLQQHREALELFDDGSTVPAGANPTLPKGRAFPSLASQTWRVAIGDALRLLIQHTQKSRFGPHIFGWCLSGLHTEEFYHWACNIEHFAGYSNSTVAAFREWLRGKYRSASILRRAWRRDDVDFDSVCVPTPQERRHSGDGLFRDSQHRNVVDFYLFWNELIPETIEYFADIVKQATGGHQVVGAFYGYMYEFAGDPEFGHNALGRFLASPHIDFLAVTASYFNRRSGIGGDYARSPCLSVSLHKKVWYHDNDTVSFLARDKLKASGYRDDHSDWTRNLSLQLDLLGYTDTAQKSKWMYRRGLGFALCHGMFQAWFDLHGGYFDAPELLSEIKALNQLAVSTVSWDRSSIAEILVVADENSCARCCPRSPLLRELLLEPQNQLIRIGAPVDHILLDDLELLETKRYKFVVFLNCVQVTSRQRRIITNKLKQDSKHLLWCSAAGWFSEDAGSDTLCRELTGFELVRTTDNRNPFRLQKDAVLKRLVDTDYVFDIGVLEQRRWISVWSPTAAMSACCYRQLARAAGVHIFNETDDVLYVNRSLICLHARSDGERVLHFPTKIELCDALSNELLATTVSEWRQDFSVGETRLFHWKTKS